MPCYDGGRGYDEEMAKYNSHNRCRSEFERVNSAYCAAMSFLVKRGLDKEFHAYAVRECGISVGGIYEEHKSEDEKRIIVAIKRMLANNEIELLVDMVKDGRLTVSEEVAEAKHA